MPWLQEGEFTKESKDTFDGGDRNDDSEQQSIRDFAWFQDANQEIE
jgi:hypothetical protein